MSATTSSRRFRPLLEREGTPRIAEALSQLTVDDLRRIALRTRVVSGTHSKSQMIQAIAHAMRRPAFLKDIVRHLSRDEVRVLDFLIGQSQGTLNVQQLAGHLESTVLDDCDWERIAELLDSLQAFGLLIRQRDELGQDAVFVPQDIHESLTGRLQPDRPAVPRVEDPVRPAASSPFSLLEDLFDFIAHAHKNEVRLTADRRVFKRAEESIKQTLCHPAADTFLPIAEERLGLPDHWQLLVDVALETGLVEESEGRLKSTGMVLEWMQRDRITLTRRALETAFRLHVPRTFPLVACYRCLEASPDTHWHGVDDLEAAVAETVLHPDPAPADLHAGVEWLTGLLFALGLLQYGEAEAGRRVYRLNHRALVVLGLEDYAPAAEEPFQIAVQPTFEVMAPSTAAFARRWELEQFADLRKRDVVLTYEITRDSVYHFLKQGGNAETLLAFLETHSARPAPQNVRFSVLDWSEAYGAVTFLDVMVLHCRTPEIAREIEATRSLQEYVRGRLSETDLIIARDGVAVVRAELGRLGYLPDPVTRHY